MPTLPLLPRRNDAAAALLRRIAFFTAFLATLLALGGAVTSQFLEDWRSRIAGNVTVQLTVSGADKEKEAADALDLLRSIKGVRAARLLSVADMRELLTPWLGDDTAFLTALPLPLVVDIAVERERFEHGSLDDALHRHGFDAFVDDHLLWFERHYGLARHFGLFILTLAALVVAWSLSIMAQSARNMFDLYRREVAIARMIGADDAAVGKAFAVRTAHIVLGGGLQGALFAPLLLGLFAHWSASLPLAFPLELLLVPAAIPPFLALAASFTTRLAIRRRLLRLP